MADKTGLTPLLDVLLSYEASIKPILDFVFDVSDTPVLVDAPYWEIKKPLIEYLVETGLDRKVVYNTITSSSFDEEFEFLTQTDIENFVLLPIESRFWTTSARMDLIDNLIKKALSYDFKGHNFMIDTCTIDYTSLGIAMSAIEKVKNKYGYPAGTAPQNLADAWKNLIPKFGNIKKYVKIAACIQTLSAGADFIFYGPIQLANIIYPNVAFVNAAYSQLLFDEGEKPPPDHPIFKIK
jgi:tetrahydromethanopterin S-methyltransferase subunit H